MSTASIPANVPPPKPLTFTVWLILIMAAIGFAFDIYELLMLPLVLPGALREILPGVTPGSPEFNHWRAMMFWIPAMAGGLFGLAGGWLTDRFGRRAVLTWSILLYAVSAFLSGFSTSMWMLLILRTTTFIGVCVEFVAAIAWLAELFPNPHQRERALGYTQAFSSVGGFMIGAVFLLIDHYARFLPAIVIPEALQGTFGTIGDPHATWRYTLMSGLIPAIPLILIRPFLPESPVWREKKEAGTLRRPSLRELFSPALARTTIVTTILVACSYGAAFGAIQQLPQIVPALPGTREKVEDVWDKYQPKLAAVAKNLAQAEKDGDTEAQGKLKAERGGLLQQRGKDLRALTAATAGKYSLWQEIGGLVGRFLLALIIVGFVSRQSLLRFFQLPGLILLPIVFAYLTVQNITLFSIGEMPVTTLHLGIFLVGLFTVAQFSFWGNYLPMAYPVHLRGTGESMAANVGGRMIGTSFAAIVSILSGYMPVEMPNPVVQDAVRLAYASAIVGTFVYLIGFIGSYFLPETKPEALEE